eukprot:gene18352-24046_t
MIKTSKRFINNFESDSFHGLLFFGGDTQAHDYTPPYIGACEEAIAIGDLMTRVVDLLTSFWDPLDIFLTPGNNDGPHNAIFSSNEGDIYSSSQAWAEVIISSVFGSTGFTGKLAASYIAKQYGYSGKNFHWAIAGRRRDALESLKKELSHNDPTLDDLDIIIADINDIQSISELVAKTKVIITTVGPFAKYGSLLVRYCAAYGTHYCDTTGETDWVREMIDKYDDTARFTGARIVSFCGHDCVPWDLIAPSGGTMDTIFHSLTNRVQFKSSLGYDPLLKTLDSVKSTNKLIVKNVSFLNYSKEHKSWTGPFVMAPVMANCIRRSNAINNYSDKLIYKEALVYPSLAAGIVNILSNIYLATAIVNQPLRSLLFLLNVIPKPGQGPSKSTLDKGFLKVTSYATGLQGHVCKATMYFPNDPGYVDTARIVVESALVLALDINSITVSGGVYTPAVCQGDLLLNRLIISGSNIQ